MSQGAELDAATEAAWVGFRRRLADHVAAMEDDAVAIIEYVDVVDVDEEGSAPYVQLCAFSGDLVRVEAASNHHLDPRCALDESAEGALLDLGWDAPEDEEGWEHFSAAFERRSADEVAVLLVRTLREVYAVPHPSFLAVDAWGDDASFPAPMPTSPEAECDGHHGLEEHQELDGVVPEDADHLRAMVDAALTQVFPDLRHDRDGDVPIVSGGSVVFVRVLDSRPSVQLLAEIVHTPVHRERLDQELRLLNDGHPLWKYALRDDTVEMTYEIPAMPFSALGLRALTQRFVGEVDQVARDLVARVGGHLFAEPPPEEDERDVVMAGLLELLHLERVRPATVAGLFEHDRLEIIRQLVRIRCGEQTCGDLDPDLVLTALRKALRLVSDGEPAARALPPTPRRSVQEPLLGGLEGLDSEDALDLGWSA